MTPPGAPSQPGKPDVETTEDGHHIVVNGRTWRATDATIPETFRAELVHELMRARRAVKAKDENARSWVQDAKVALGERGEPWWEPPSEEGQRRRIAATIRALLRHRAGKTICPSDVARTLGADTWRELMPVVRHVAADLVDQGHVVVQQKGEAVDPSTAKGPIRLAPGAKLTGLPDSG